MPRRPLVAAVFVEGSSHIVEWSKAPYTIRALGKRTDWDLEISNEEFQEQKLLGYLQGQGPLEEWERLQVRLQLTSKTITQSPQPLLPLIERLGDGECLITFWGAKHYH